MAVRTDTTDEEVDTPSLNDHLLVTCALSLQVLGVAIEDVDVLLRAVNMVEEVLSHE